ncbi:hypothetical protein ACHAXN_008976 [Cyclotella atomus]
MIVAEFGGSSATSTTSSDSDAPNTPTFIKICSPLLSSTPSLSLFIQMSPAAVTAKPSIFSITAPLPLLRSSIRSFTSSLLRIDPSSNE